MAWFRDQRQYQAKTEPVFVPTIVTAVSTVALASQVIFNSYFIYQTEARPVAVIESITLDKWYQNWRDPSVLAKTGIKTNQQDAYTAPDKVIPSITPVPAGIVTAESSDVTFKRRLIYQAVTQPSFVAEIVTVDKWIYPWRDPVRQKPGLRASLQQSAIGPVLEPDSQITQNYESRWHYPWSEPVRQKPGLLAKLQSAQVQGAVQTPEFIFPDKWTYPWSEPVRQKIGLAPRLQQALIAPVLDPNTQVTQDYESRWHYAWSEPVRTRRLATAQQQAFTTDPRTPETVTADKWIYPWSDPVRQKLGLRPSLQQALIATTLDPDTQITQDFESRWHYPWTEPVRLKRQLPAGEQQSLAQGPVQTPEFITTDKWIYGWSEPVRQKIGLAVRLQQALIAPVLDPNTQISQDFESRWHYAWTEPVRFLRLASAQQQVFAFQPPSFEIVTVDKWVYPWSEPVRQKPGLQASLQQSLIATTLEPETQIIQDFESRWHYSWSEPVRIKRQLPAGEQQSLAQGPVQTPEFITGDKWAYGWSEPVRQKVGLAVRLQQALIAPVLNPNTQITQDFESRWHYGWSEPVRFRRFASAQQQAFAFQPPSFEIVTPDKWIYPWSEPVRQKAGLRASLQQALIATTLNPDTQITQNYESRWHYAWSEPVRTRRLATAQQQTVAAQFFVAEIVTVDKWFKFLEEPVRQKPGLRSSLQQTQAQTVLEPEAQIIQTYESRWHYAWSEPVRFRRLPTAEHQAAIAPATSVFEAITLDKWVYQWRDPVRFKIDPKRAIALASSGPIGPFLNPETQITQRLESRWHYPWSEPKRFKQGLKPNLQQAYIAPPRMPLPNLFGDARAGTVTASSPVFYKKRFIYQPFAQPPAFPTLTRLIQWFRPLEEPVRLKIGLGTRFQQFFQTDTKPIQNLVTITLLATETNTDSASFSISTYNAVAEVVVSIEEIPNLAGARVSIVQIPFIDSAAASIEEE